MDAVSSELRAIVADVRARYPGLVAPDPHLDWGVGVSWVLDRLSTIASERDRAAPPETSAVASLPARHDAQGDTPMRWEYAYDAAGRGVHALVVSRVLEAWSGLHPAGDATAVLRAAGSAYLLETSNLARVAARASLDAVVELEGK